MNTACFDIGGTFIKYGIMSSDGKLSSQGKMETPVEQAPEQIPSVIASKVAEFKQELAIDHIGISSCGLVDHQSGKIIFSSNIPNYSGLPLAEEVSKRTGLPVKIENDVRCAGLGEMAYGAGRGKQDVVLLTLGTGIGGAIINDGKLIRGNGNLAGELGHMTIVHNGEPCPCGNVGCFERYASTSALTRFYEQITGEKIGGKAIMDRKQKSEPAANDAYDTFISYLVTGLVNIAHLYNPEVIIIGGGITAQGQKFLDDIEQAYKQKVMKVYKDTTKLVLAELENDAALYGAASLFQK